MVSLPNWEVFRDHPTQQQVWREAVLGNARLVSIVAGRGSGKTELARRKVVMSLPVKKRWSDPIYCFCLPTYNQAKKVAWEKIIQKIPESWIQGRPNVSELYLRTIFGSILYVVGMDKPQRIEGLQVDGVILDESSDQKPGVFARTIRPMLTERNGWCWRIGVPKRSGIGRMDFKSFFERGLEEDNPIYSYWWESEGVLTSEEIEEVKQITDTQDYLEQYRAKWLDLGGTVYHAYTSENVTDHAQYDPTKSILVGCDFNVDPMSWVLAQRHSGRLYIFDEVFIRNTNTEKCLKYLAKKYSYHDQGWQFVGDASARARKTSASISDYLIIKNFEALLNKKVFFPKRNPKLQDRFATMNAALCNVKGERRLLINPSCKHLINDLTSMSYKEKTTIVENYAGTDIGHMSDGCGYLVMRAIPLKLHQNEAMQVIIA